MNFLISIEQELLKFGENKELSIMCELLKPIEVTEKSSKEKTQRQIVVNMAWNMFDRLFQGEVGAIVISEHEL